MEQQQRQQPAQGQPQFPAPATEASQPPLLAPQAARPQNSPSPQIAAPQSAVNTASTTPIPSPRPFSPTQSRPMMSLPQQSVSESTTPLGMSNSPYLHPLQGHKVRETHKALVDTDFITGRKTINQYSIIDELGRGVHGKVKLARNLDTEENVAIKIIPRYSKKRRLGTITTRSTHDKVKREIAILKKIRHPNVVALLEVIDDPELKKIYMVLEHVELGEVVWRKKGLPDISAYERRRVERETQGVKATMEEEKYDRHIESRQAIQDTKRARISKAQQPQTDYWSLEYGAVEEDELEMPSRYVWRDDADSIARSMSNPESNMASRGTSRAPSRTHSAQSVSRMGTHHLREAALSLLPHDEDDLGTPGPLRSNPGSSSALDGTMYGAYMEDAALRGRSPSMADSIVSQLSSIDYGRAHDPFADDYSYVPCFTLEDARSTFRDTVLGLEYLHYEGIIHRDIKPANLLWTRDHRTKISDFGVSYFGRPIRDGEADEAISESEAHDFDNDLELAKTVGTPAFFAPELCYTDPDSDQVQPKITEQIDVWSLGVTLYCLIFARIPFLGVDEWQMFRKIATEEVYIPRQRLRPVDPSTKPDEKSLYTRQNRPPYRDDGELAYEQIDDNLYNLLTRMLTKNPDKRIRLRDVKRHAWVMQGLTSPIGWLEDTDPSRRTSGGKIQVDEREMARAVIPLTLLERARSVVKKAYGKMIHPRTDRAESSSRRRAASSAASSSGESPATGPAMPTSRDNRRRSLRTDDYFSSAVEHPLSQSVTASPHHSPLDEEPGTQASTSQRYPIASGGVSDANSARDAADRPAQSLPARTFPRHSHARSVASAFLHLGAVPSPAAPRDASRESLTVPPTPLYDSPTDDTGCTTPLRRARDTRSAADESGRARSVDRGFFGIHDKHAEPKVALSTAVAPGSVETPHPSRPLRLSMADASSLRMDRSFPQSPFVFSPRTPSTYQHGQPKSDPNIHQRQRSMVQPEERPATAQQVLTPLPRAAATVDPAAVPCPPSPEQDVFAQQPEPPSRTDTAGTLVSSNSTSLGTLPTPLTSPSDTTSPICVSASGPSVRESVEQMLVFQSDPSLPALLSGASSVSADPEGDFLGGPGVVKPSVIDTTDSLTPPALAKDSMAAVGSPLEQQDLVQDGAIPVELDDGVARAPVAGLHKARPRVLDHDDDDSDSDEGLTMAKSRKKQSPKGSPPMSGTISRSLTARRRDTNISVTSTETARQVGPGE